MNELQKLRQERSEHVAAMRGILTKVKTEKRDITDNDMAESKLHEDAIKRLDVAIAAEERVANLEAEQARSAGTVTRPNGDRGAGHQSPIAKPGEFRNIGEWIAAAYRGEIRPDLEHRDQSLGTGSQGGYMVPRQFLSELLMLDPEQQIIRPRARVIGAGDTPDAALDMPALAQGANGVYGGVAVTWGGEAAAVPKTGATLEQVTLKPNEASAYIPVSNMLLRNAPQASGMLSGMLGSALLGAEDYEFLVGNGIGRPLGVTKSTGRKTVVRNTKNKFYYDDLIGMKKALLPGAIPIWIISQSLHDQVTDMKDSSGNRIYTESNLVKGFPSDLDGIPCKFTGNASLAGTEGDVTLVDLRYYLIKDGSGPFISFSEHVLFLNNQTAIKIVRSVDGQSWVKSPLLLKDGSTTVSPIVTLSTK